MFRKILTPTAAALLAVTPATAVLLATPAYAGVPGSTSPINLDAQGVALGGYDPVAYFESGKSTRGLAGISSSHDGARYLFASAAHRRTFLKDPRIRPAPSPRRRPTGRPSRTSLFELGRGWGLADCREPCNCDRVRCARASSGCTSIGRGARSPQPRVPST